MSFPRRRESILICIKEEDMNPSLHGNDKLVSVGRSNRIDDNGGIGPGRLLDSGAYPVFDPGGHACRRGTSHDGLGSVARGNIGGGAEFGAAGVGRGAIVIAVLVEAGMPEAVIC